MNGVNASAGQTPITLMKPANPAASDSAAGVPVWLFASLVTTALTIDNLETDQDTRIVVAVAGDLVASPPASC